MNPLRTRRDAAVDTLHGVDVPDPYRWLEDGDDPEVQQWVAEQNRLTRTALDARPERERWHERLVALMGLPVAQGAQVRGDRVVVLEREAGAQQARLAVRSLADPPRPPVVLCDPSAGVADAAAAIDWFWASPDGGLVAYGLSEGGTENSVLRVVRTDDATHLPDEIPNCRASSVGWEPDSSGFCYVRYPEGDQYHRTVHHHTLGADWRSDPVVWADHPTPETWAEVSMSPGGRYVLVEAVVGWSRRDLHLLDRTTGAWRDVIAGVEAVSDLVFADDETLIGTTNLGASLGRVVRVDLTADDVGPDAWHELVPERDAVVGSPRAMPDGGFLLRVTRNGVDAIEWWDRDASEKRVVHGIGVASVGALAVDRETGDALALLAGFDSPAALWRVVEHQGEPTVERWSPPTPADQLPRLAVTQVEYPSRDGTCVGLFLIHRHDLEPDAGTPTILNGYGGFAISETPVWSPTIAAWCAAGGQYAITGLRGGLEHGEAWHDAGRRDRKQNVFDDFHAAADWLVTEGRTSRERLAIAGGSNGGLLVGAALTQRPDLCRAVWCAVPLLDMIRFPQFLIAKLWKDEYGDPDVAEEFGWLWAYSPYHRVRDGQRYPAVLLTTAEGDTRVDPLHARKMAAMLQSAAADQEERPVLLHQEGRAGHGQGKPVGKRAAEQADVLAFFTWQLGAGEDLPA